MAIMLSFLDFHEILMCDNVLYCAALMLELAAMIQLRIAQPNMRRPFQIPAGTAGVCIIMCGLVSEKLRRTAISTQRGAISRYQ